MPRQGHGHTFLQRLAHRPQLRRETRARRVPATGGGQTSASGVGANGPAHSAILSMSDDETVRARELFERRMPSRDASIFLPRWADGDPFSALSLCGRPVLVSRLLLPIASCYRPFRAPRPADVSRFIPPEECHTTRAERVSKIILVMWTAP